MFVSLAKGLFENMFIQYEIRLAHVDGIGVNVKQYFYQEFQNGILCHYENVAFSFVSIVLPICARREEPYVLTCGN